MKTMASKHRGASTAGKPPTQRQLRVGEEIRHALADLFRRGDFHDPELAELNVTVTEVRISPDLRNATAFVTPLGGGHMDEALRALRRSAPFLRGQIARAINLRHAPTIGFEGDTSFDYAHRIDTILHSPEVARDLAPHDGGDEDDRWDEAGDEDAPQDGDAGADADEDTGAAEGQRRGS